VELDAIPPAQLRSLVEKAITHHIPARRYNALMQEQEQERAEIARLIDGLTNSRQ
jgi:hypothetical protein